MLRVKTMLTLPTWLDHLIFEELGAKYCTSNSDMTVIDWDKSDVLNYLGTYFPRSYTESYLIFKNYFKGKTINREEISIFDFGCGTGGEILGLIQALHESSNRLKRIKITALDGNQYALRLYEQILTKFQSQIDIQIENRPALIEIEDFYDLHILETILSTQYDIIITYKAICEIVTKERLEQDNPYEHITNVLLPKLKDKGIMLLVDVTTYNSVSQEWLPKMMDKGLKNINCKIISKNQGYNQLITLSHSKKGYDRSKITWRLIQKSN